MNGVNVRVVGTKIVVEVDTLPAIAGVVGDAAITVVRRNTEEVQGKGNWRVFEELFADDFVDHTPQPGTTPDKDGVRVLYRPLRAAFPVFRPEIHWQVPPPTS